MHTLKKPANPRRRNANSQAAEIIGPGLCLFAQERERISIEAEDRGAQIVSRLALLAMRLIS